MPETQPTTSPIQPATGVLRTPGTAAAEEVLLDRLSTASRELTDNGRFQRSLWVVVPTRVLRRHLQRRIVEHLGTTLGVSVITLGALVRSLLARDSQPTSPGPGDGGDDLLFDLLAMRHLADQREVDLDRVRGPVAAVSDLVNAGVELEHLTGLIELFAEVDASVDDIHRAEQLFIAAGQTLRKAQEVRLQPERIRYQRARDVLDRLNDGPRHLFVYGFADLTGVGADFLQALVNRFPSTIVLNRPPEPDPKTPIPAIDRFLTRIEERLPPAIEVGESQKPAIHLFRAAKPAAEMQEIGLSIRRLLRAGVAANSIGVVLRQPQAYALTTLNELTRLGIPCSAPGVPGLLLPEGARLRALCDVLEKGRRASIDRWLDARWDTSSYNQTPVFEVRRRLALAGLRTLGQMEQFDDVRPHSGSLDAAWGQDAIALLRQLQTWPVGVGETHAHHLLALATALGWPKQGTAMETLLAECRKLKVELTFEEFVYWLRRSAQDRGRSEADPWRLGGVHVLSIQDARELTFDYLFVPGMNRGSFPRNIRGDSELREEVRELVATGVGLLPDLPLASRAHDEEKYLFAQLLSSAAEVTLSYAERSHDERLLPRSPLLALLPDLGTLDNEGIQLPDGRQLHREDTWADLPPLTRKIQAGLAKRELQGVESSPTMAAVLDDFNGEGPSPFLGWVGTASNDSSHRNRPLYVTRLEGYARCPWQIYIRDIVKVRLRQDPDLIAPDLPPLAVGILAHDLLKDIAIKSGIASGRWHDAVDSWPKALSWPDDEQLEELAIEAAHVFAAEAGVLLPGYAETLAQAVTTTLVRAKTVDLESQAQVVAVEVEGIAKTADRNISFRADRLEIHDGVLLATDYKTGSRALSGRPSTRVERAQWLQLPAYLIGGAQRARLLFIGDREHPHGAEVGASGADTQLLDQFVELTSMLIRNWEGGNFFPRVTTQSGSRPRACTWCDFAEACSERDPFARDRIKQAAESDPDSGDLWRLKVS